MGYRYHQAVNIYNASLREELQSQMTKFEVLQGKISAIISESDLKKYTDGTNTWYSAYSNLVLTVGGLTTSFNELNTKYNEADGRITTLDSKVATYKQSVDGFSADISQVHTDYGTMNTRVTTVEGTLDGFGGRLDSVETNYAAKSWTTSQISASKDDILLNVSQSYINGFVIQYALGDDDVTAPSSGWSASTPAWTEGKYIWQRIATTKPGSGTTYSTPICVQGEKGIQGPKGDSGDTSYFHVKYSNDGGQTFTGNSGETVGDWIGTYVDYTERDSTSVTSYTWAKLKGAQGEKGDQGIPGVGQDGKTSYLHIKYSNDGGQTFTGNSGETPGDWIGQYVDFNSTDSTSVSSYTWSKTKGEKGDKGDQGVQGPKGSDGTQYYTWIKYADTPTTGMSDNPSGKTYFGIATNKTTSSESTNYSDYTWSLIKGEKGDQGIPGNPGANGQTYYTWVKYADTPTSGMSDTPDGKTYIGLAYNKTSQTESTNYSDYTWSKFKGETGATGATGVGLSSLKQQYTLHTSSSTPPKTTATWAYAPPAYQAGKYYWMRTEMNFTDGTTSYSTPVYWSEFTSLEGWRVEASLKIENDHIISTVINSSNFGDSVVSKIEQWAGGVKIIADRIDLKGYTTVNGYFAIDSNGRFSSTGGNIAGWTITNTRLYADSDDGLKRIYLAKYNWDKSGSTSAICIQERANSSTTKWHNNLVLFYDGSIASIGYENIQGTKEQRRTTIANGDFRSNGDCYIGAKENRYDHIYMIRTGLANDQQYNSFRFRHLGTNNDYPYLYNLTPCSTEYTVKGWCDNVPSGTPTIVDGYDLRLGVGVSSSVRYKEIGEKLDYVNLDSLYDYVNVYMAKYKSDYLPEDDERFGMYYPMFIAEEIESVMPEAVDHANGLPETWNTRIMIPIMFQMIKNQKKEINELKEQLSKGGQNVTFWN